MASVADLFANAVYEPALHDRDKHGVLAALTRTLAERDSRLASDDLLRALEQREAQASTIVMPGVAVPHARLGGFTGLALAVGRSDAGIDWGGAPDESVRLVFLLAGSAAAAGTFLKALAAISATVRDERCRAALAAACDGSAMRRALLEQPALGGTRR